MRGAVRQDPSCTEAWLGLAWLAKSRRRRRELLCHVLALQPDHAKAKMELARLELGRRSPSLPTTAPGSRGQVAGRVREGDAGAGRKIRALPAWILIVLAIALLGVILLWVGPVDESLARLLATPTPSPTPSPTLTPAELAGRFAPQLEEALSAENWERALELVAIMQALDPTGSDVATRALAAHMRYGKAMVRDGRPEEALAQFSAAVALFPADVEARLWSEATGAYLAGREAQAASNWQVAIQSFTQVYEQLPEFGDVLRRLVDAYLSQAQAAVDKLDWTAAISALAVAKEIAPTDTDVADMLALAYRERGIAGEEQGQLQQARLDLEAALAIWPADQAAKAHYDQVMYRLFPPKRIEIDISAQRLYAFEGDTQVFKFVVSTGLPGRDTAPGHFKVLDKIPMAYSEVWRLKMPNWLGIYYVGKIENGIHALPIRPDGSVMWGGLLGQKASYGCVILDNKASKALYNWAEIGTTVDIHN